MADSAERARDGTVPPVVWLLPDRTGRGPKPAHSREQITAVAIRIADADGLDAVTMRRVAAEVGCGTMTLYRYVPTKDHLLDLMIDATEGETILTGIPAGDWRAGLRAVAEMHRDTLLRHPWLATLQSGRPVFGPNTLRNLEQGFSILGSLELDIDQILVMVTTLVSYVRGEVVAELAEEEAQRRTGLTTEQWQAWVSPYVETLMASGKYPAFNRIITDAKLPHSGPAEGFAQGLELILDGYAARLAAAPGPAAPPRS